MVVDFKFKERCSLGCILCELPTHTIITNMLLFMMKYNGFRILVGVSPIKYFANLTAHNSHVSIPHHNCVEVEKDFLRNTILDEVLICPHNIPHHSIFVLWAFIIYQSGAQKATHGY